MSFTVAQLEAQKQVTQQAFQSGQITQAGYYQWLNEQNKLIAEARAREAQQAQQQTPAPASTASNAYWTTVTPATGMQGMTAEKYENRTPEPAAPVVNAPQQPAPAASAPAASAPAASAPVTPAAPAASTASNAYWTTVTPATGMQGMTAEKYENRTPDVPVVSPSTSIVTKVTDFFGLTGGFSQDAGLFTTLKKTSIVNPKISNNPVYAAVTGNYQENRFTSFAAGVEYKPVAPLLSEYELKSVVNTSLLVGAGVVIPIAPAAALTGVGLGLGGAQVVKTGFQLYYGEELSLLSPSEAFYAGTTGAIFGGTNQLMSKSLSTVANSWVREGLRAGGNAVLGGTLAGATEMGMTGDTSLKTVGTGAVIAGGISLGISGASATSKYLPAVRFKSVPMYENDVYVGQKIGFYKVSPEKSLFGTPTPRTTTPIRTIQVFTPAPVKPTIIFPQNSGLVPAGNKPLTFVTPKIPSAPNLSTIHYQAPASAATVATVFTPAVRPNVSFAPTFNPFASVMRDGVFYELQPGSYKAPTAAFTPAVRPNVQFKPTSDPFGSVMRDGVFYELQPGSYKAPASATTVATVTSKAQPNIDLFGEAVQSRNYDLRRSAERRVYYNMFPESQPTLDFPTYKPVVLDLAVSSPAEVAANYIPQPETTVAPPSIFGDLQPKARPYKEATRNRELENTLFGDVYKRNTSMTAYSTSDLQPVRQREIVQTSVKREVLTSEEYWRRQLRSIDDIWERRLRAVSGETYPQTRSGFSVQERVRVRTETSLTPKVETQNMAESLAKTIVSAGGGTALIPDSGTISVPADLPASFTAPRFTVDPFSSIEEQTKTSTNAKLSSETFLRWPRNFGFPFDRHDPFTPQRRTRGESDKRQRREYYVASPEKMLRNFGKGGGGVFNLFDVSAPKRVGKQRGKPAGKGRKGKRGKR